MTRTPRWQDWTSFALGLWLAVSPWIVGYESDHVATANAAFAGVALALGAHFAIGLGELWAEWLNFAVGLWLLAAPFLLEFGPGPVATGICIIVGCLACWLAASALELEKDVAKLLQKRTTVTRP